MNVKERLMKAHGHLIASISEVEKAFTELELALSISELSDTFVVEDLLSEFDVLYDDATEVRRLTEEARNSLQESS